MELSFFMHAPLSRSLLMRFRFVRSSVCSLSLGKGLNLSVEETTVMSATVLTLCSILISSKKDVLLYADALLFEGPKWVYRIEKIGKSLSITISSISGSALTIDDAASVLKLNELPES